MSRRMAGVTESLAANRTSSRRHCVTTSGGGHRGYGWPATLELLSPPIGKPVDSRQTIKMDICPSCALVHKTGGRCLPSRHVAPARFIFGSPAMVMGNTNERELNSRVVQQLIAANLTLAEAWTWILKLQRNSTLKNTSFPLVVTDEVYTIGFDPALMNVLPNMTVENSGNHSVPPPPARRPSYWERVWNSFTGLVSSVWNAVVAVCTFVANVALAVIKWGIRLAVAIATGQGLQYIYDTVVKPFVELVLWFIRWILDLVMAIANAILSPILSLVRGAIESVTKPFLGNLVRLANEVQVTGNASPQTRSMLGDSLLGGDFLAIFAIVMIVEVVLAALSIVTLPFSFIASLIFGIILDIILIALFGTVLDTSFGRTFSDTEPTVHAASITATSMQVEGEGSSIPSSVFQIVGAIFGAISTTKAAALLESAKVSGLPWFLLAVGISLAFVAVFVELYVGLTKPAQVSGPVGQALGFTMAMLGILDCALLWKTEAVTQDQQSTKRIGFATGLAAVVLGLVGAGT